MGTDGRYWPHHYWILDLHPTCPRFVEDEGLARVPLAVTVRVPVHEVTVGGDWASVDRAWYLADPAPSVEQNVVRARPRIIVHAVVGNIVDNVVEGRACPASVCFSVNEDNVVVVSFELAAPCGLVSIVIPVRKPAISDEKAEPGGVAETLEALARCVVCAVCVAVV